MKNSIKYRKSGSAPAGQPPFAHRSESFTKEKKNKKTGATTRQPQSPLRELIFFARDTVTKTTVIGPVLFGRDGASALEHGGRTRRKNPRTGKEESVGIAPHPFARPAGEAEAKKFPELLRQLVH
jgi:hypothetical protein